MSGFLPTCPRCADLSSVGAPFCESCGGPLTEAFAYRDRPKRLLRDERGRFFMTERPAVLR